MSSIPASALHPAQDGGPAPGVVPAPAPAPRADGVPVPPRVLSRADAGRLGVAAIAAALGEACAVALTACAAWLICRASQQPPLGALMVAVVAVRAFDDKQRGQAIGIWSGAMAGGIALGSVMSGLIL
ncbi:hypothetical protein ABT084_33915, partial [Streptomyces sp. NPDC002138]